MKTNSKITLGFFLSVLFVGFFAFSSNKSVAKASINNNYMAFEYTSIATYDFAVNDTIINKKEVKCNGKANENTTGEEVKCKTKKCSETKAGETKKTENCSGTKTEATEKTTKENGCG